MPTRIPAALYKPGYDYIVTEEERKKFSPKVTTDEVLLGVGRKYWQDVNDSSLFSEFDIYRRKRVNPVGCDETRYDYIISVDDREHFSPKLDTDEYQLDCGVQWSQVREGASTGGMGAFLKNNIYRRLKQPPVGGYTLENAPTGALTENAEGAAAPDARELASSEQWIETKERPPIAPCWYMVRGSDKVYLSSHPPYMESCGALRWQPAIVPLPPAPKTQEELDIEAAKQAWLTSRAAHVACNNSYAYVDGFVDGLRYMRTTKATVPTCCPSRSDESF